MISPETIQQITSRIDIIDVVGEFVKLKKRGANYLGLCPFHNEKTPSFTVSPAKEIYKCFGCGKSGNTISFLMEAEKYSYVDSLKWLANRYGIEIEETFSSPEVKQQQLTADSLFAINNFAQKFFSEQLLETDEGHTGLSYLKDKRGFRDEIIKKFQLGYNPETRNAFAKAAVQNQFNPELLVKSGLTVLRNDELVDNYRGRIIFPIHNNTGKIIGFGARIIASNDRAPKYINTPENEIYVKSKILYGSYFARHTIDKNDECLLVEGYTDVISLHQNGIENVVASGGTSLTTDQLRIIKKYTNNLTIIYDGDAAGIKAALRGLDMALEESLNVKLVLIPDKEDPDSYVNKVGPVAFQKFIAENKKDFILFQLEVMLKEAGNDVAKKNEVSNDLAKTLAKIVKPQDIVKRQQYIRICSDLLQIDERALTTLVNYYIRETIVNEKKAIPLDEGKFFQESATDTESSSLDEAIHLLLESEYQEREVIKRLIEYGARSINGRKVSDLIFETLDKFHLTNITLTTIAEKYRGIELQDGRVQSKYIFNMEDLEINNLIAGLLNFPFDLAKWSQKIEGYSIEIDQDVERAVDSALTYYQIRKIKINLADVEKDIKRDEKNLDKFKNQHLRVYQALKEYEIELVKQLGSVIIK